MNEIRFELGLYWITLWDHEVETIFEQNNAERRVQGYRLSPMLRASAKRVLGDIYLAIVVINGAIIMKCTSDVLEWFLEQRGYRYSLRLKNSFGDIENSWLDIDSDIVAFQWQFHTVIKMRSEQSQLLLMIKLHNRLTDWGSTASIKQLADLMDQIPS